MSRGGNYVRKLITLITILVLCTTQTIGWAEEIDWSDFSEHHYVEFGQQLIRPSETLINGDVYTFFLQKVIDVDESLILEAIERALRSYGYELSDLSYISGGRFTAEDARNGQITKERAADALADYNLLLDAYILYVNALLREFKLPGYPEGLEITQELAEQVISSYRFNERQSRILNSSAEEIQKDDNALLDTGKTAASMADEYSKSITRNAYISEKMNDDSIKSYIIEINEPMTAYVNIPAGFYEMCYMGNQHINVQISSGKMYKSGDYPLAELSWSKEEGTLYEIYKYPICPGFTIQVTDCGDGKTEYLFITLVEEIDF